MKSLWIGLVVFILSGCSRTAMAPMALPHHVHGRVVFSDRTPLKGGVIAFVPKETRAEGGLVRYECENLVDRQGTYKLGLNGNERGIPTGEYKVILKPREINEVKNSNSKRIPLRYRDTSRTPLTYNVREGDNTFDIELK